MGVGQRCGGGSGDFGGCVVCGLGAWVALECRKRRNGWRLFFDF